MPSASASPTSVEVVAYPRLWRWVAAAFFCFSRTNLIVALVAVLRADDPPITPLMLAEFLAIFAFAPGLASRLVQRAFATRLEVDGGVLHLRAFRRRIEAPAAAIEAVRPWALPVPAPGFTLVLGGNPRLPLPIQPRTAAAYVAALERVDAAAGERALAHPISAYVRARATVPRGFWRGPIAKFVLFALPWGALFFNLDQHISYGGTFGQYYLQGPLPWLRSFAVHWLGIGMYLLLYASLWRALAEATALAAAWVAPAAAVRVRTAVEIVCLAALYAGVPLLVVSRFVE